MVEKNIVLGVGNVLLTDEGLGVHAVKKLMDEYAFPENVEVYDGGVTGMMGLLPIIEDADHLIIIDAVNGPGEPGALYRYTLDEFKLAIPKKLSVHDIGVLECLAMAGMTGREPVSVIVLGAKPVDMKTPGIGLTETIESRLGELVEMITSELRSLGAEPIPKVLKEKMR